MNNRGFTLVELLAVVVVLGLVMGIATYGITNTINNSKKKTEAVFVDKLSDAISDYIALYSSEFVKNGEEWRFQKCSNTDCNQVVASKLKTSTGIISVNALIEKNLLDSAKVINPANKKKCFNSSKNPEIKIFRDSDFVYYYYVDLSGSNTLCDISDDNAIINTLPEELVNVVIGEDNL